MRVQADDGTILNFPDEASHDEILAYMEKNHPTSPNVLERTAGHLSKGVAGLAQKAQNIASYFDDDKIGALQDVQDLFTDNKYVKQIEKYPETSFLGKLAGGAVEFLPEVPLYSATGSAVLGAASKIPGLARLATPLMTKSVPLATKVVGDTAVAVGTKFPALANYGKAITRGAIEGGVVGTIAGTPASTPLMEKLQKGGEEAVGFAGATAVLHPAFATLGYVGKSIFRRARGKITPEQMETKLEEKAKTNPAAADELENFRSAMEEQKTVKENKDGLYVPQGKAEPIQGDLGLEGPIPQEGLDRLAELGYSAKDVEGLPDSELLRIIENQVKNPKPSVVEPIVPSKEVVTIRPQDKVGAEPTISGENLTKEETVPTSGEKITTVTKSSAKPVYEGELPKSGYKSATLDGVEGSVDRKGNFYTMEETKRIYDLNRMGYTLKEIGDMSKEDMKSTIDRINSAPEPTTEQMAKSAELGEAARQYIARLGEPIYDKNGQITGRQNRLTEEARDAKEHADRIAKVVADTEKEIEEIMKSDEPEPLIAQLIGKIQERNLDDDVIDSILDETAKRSPEEIALRWKVALERRNRAIELGLLEKEKPATIEPIDKKEPPKTRAEHEALMKEVNKKGKDRRKRGELTQQEEADKWLKEHEGEIPKDEESETELNFDDTTMWSDPTGIGHLIDYIMKKIEGIKTKVEAPSNGLVHELNGSTLSMKNGEEFATSIIDALSKNVGRLFRSKLMTPDIAYQGESKMAEPIFDLHKRVYESNFAASLRNQTMRAAEMLLDSIEKKENIRGIIERDGIARAITKTDDMRIELDKRLLDGEQLTKKEMSFLKTADERIANMRKELSKIDSKVYTEAEKKAAQMVKNELAAVREKYKGHLRNEMKDSLNEDEYAALNELISGKPMEDVIEKYKEKILINKLGRRYRVKNVDEKVIRDTYKEYTDIDNWGLDDYVSHYERGNIKIVSGNKLYAKAVSISDAARKFADLVEEHPGMNFQLDTSTPEFLNGLSKDSYNKIVNRLQKGIKDNIEEINNQAARRLAQKGLKGQFYIEPSQAFSPFVIPRRELLKGEKNIFDTIYGYMYSMERKMGLDPAIDDIRKLINRKDVVGTEEYRDASGNVKTREIKRDHLNEEQKDFLISLVNDVKGRYYKMDQICDKLLEGTGYTRAFSRMIQKSREIEANIKLGYAPIKGVINGLSGIGHIWTKVGTRYIAEGARFLGTDEGRAFIKAMEPYLGVNVVESATGELSTRGTFEKWGWLSAPKTEFGRRVHNIIEPLGAFQYPEIPVRKLTLASNYLMAKASGLSETAARDAAIKANWFQQFTYDMASLPEVMRGPIGRLIGQFKPYMMKELEFIASLDKPELARYMTMQLALAGPRGAILIMKSLPVIGLFGALDNWEEWMNKEWPRASRGLAGFLGIDTSAAATFQFPSTPRDWLGPTLSDIGGLYQKLIADPVKNGSFEGNDALKALTSTVPITRYYAEMFKQVIDKDGWVKNEKGQRLYHIDDTASFVAKSVAGAEPIELNRLRSEERILATRTERINEQKVRTIDNILDAVSKGKEIDQSDIEAMTKLGIKPGSLRRAAIFRVLDPKQRRLLQTEIIRRPEILEMYPEAADLQ